MDTLPSNDNLVSTSEIVMEAGALLPVFTVVAQARMLQRKAGKPMLPFIHGPRTLFINAEAGVAMARMSASDAKLLDKVSSEALRYLHDAARHGRIQRTAYKTAEAKVLRYCEQHYTNASFLSPQLSAK